jgi:hypothetical protein
MGCYTNLMKLIILIAVILILIAVPCGGAS